MVMDFILFPGHPDFEFSKAGRGRNKMVKSNFGFLGPAWATPFAESEVDIQ